MIRIIYGLFITLFGVWVIVFLDLYLYNTICNFGGLSAYFAKNPFAGSAIVAVALFNFFFAAWSFVGFMFMRNKL